MSKFLTLKTFLLALLLMLIGTFLYWPTKSISFHAFNIQVTKPSSPDQAINSYTGTTICNPMPGPKLGNPFHFIDSKPTESLDFCGSSIYFNPAAIIVDFIIFLTFANIIIFAQARLLKISSYKTN